MKKPSAVILLACCLAACGGGGGGSTAVPQDLPTAPAAAMPVPVRAPAPEGVYNGDTALTLQYNSTLVVLENGEAWYLGTRNWGRGNFSYRGTGRVLPQLDDSAIYRADDFQIVGTDLSSVPLALQTVQQAFQYTESAGGASVTLVAPNTEPALMARTPPQQYVYERPARLESLAGEWGWTQTPSGRGAAWTVQGSAITAPESFVSTSGGRALCAASGTLAPRASGRNVFDVVMRFTGPSCGVAGQVFRGIAVSYASAPFLGSYPLLDVALRNEDGSVLANVRLGRREVDPVVTGVYTGNYADEAPGATVAIHLRGGETWVAGGAVGVQRGTFTLQGTGGPNLPLYKSSDFRFRPDASPTTAEFLLGNGLRFPLVRTTGTLQELVLQRLRTDRLAFNRTAVPDDIAGAWNSSHEPARGGIWSVTGDALAGRRAKVMVRTSGPTEQSTYCDVGGTVRAHPSGDNAYALSLQFSGDGCTLAGLSLPGVAVAYFGALLAQPDGSQQVDASHATFDLLVMSADGTASARVRLVRP
jgi:hypothetical protein